MFGKQSDPSRTEEATPKRKRKQRQEGNVPKSQELGKIVSIVGGLIILNLWLGPMSDKIKLIFRQFLEHSTTFNVTEETVYALFFSLSIDIAYLLLPVFNKWIYGSKEMPQNFGLSITPIASGGYYGAGIACVF